MLRSGALTDKDRRDLDAALAAEVDWVALSFIQRPDDIAEARKIVQGRAGIMAKIEKPQALQQLDEIMELSDAIMVARGDLGVEMPLEAVPGVQKQMTRMARRAGKPVVVATQMLESMISAPVPTRAEVSDVATAVFEGADAVMLSAESAAGEYPVEAVETMNRIAEAVEQDKLFPTHHPGAAHRAGIDRRRHDHLGGAADRRDARARGDRLLHLVRLDRHPRLARAAGACRSSRSRRSRKTARRLSLVWGLHCVVTEDAHNIDEMVDRACSIACREGFAAPGQRIIITAGVPFGTPGATNLLRIAFIGPDGMSGI